MTGAASTIINDKPTSTINIKHDVPIVLDLERMNYDIWRELFEMHCIGYGVDNHLQPTPPPSDKAPATSDNTEWNRLDSIVKSWLYGTISDQLLHMIFKKNAKAVDAWQNIEKVFRDNKASKIIQLDNELRNISMGNSSITDYCNRVKLLADQFESMDAEVPETNLVAYTLNGLSLKYRQVAITIRHKQPPPSFWNARSMLALEEHQMKLDDDRQNSLNHSDNSSSPTVLTTEATHQNNQFNQTNHRGGHRGGRGGGRNYRGRGGGRQSGRNNYAGGGSGNNYTNAGSQQRGDGVGSSGAWAYGWYQLPLNKKSSLLPLPSTHTSLPPNGPRQLTNQAQQHVFFGQQPPSSPINQQQAYVSPQQSSWPTGSPVEATNIPQMFNTLSLNDPGNTGWYMDTGATAHLHANAGLPDPQTSHAM